MVLIFISLLTKLATEKFLGTAIIALLKFFAKKTTNTVDDLLVLAAEEAIFGKK